jgi:hypothetical protein
MSHSWLQKKRKADLIDLAQKARLPEYAELGLRVYCDTNECVTGPTVC